MTVEGKYIYYSALLYMYEAYPRMNKTDLYKSIFLA